MSRFSKEQKKHSLIAGGFFLFLAVLIALVAESFTGTGKDWAGLVLFVVGSQLMAGTPKFFGVRYFEGFKGAVLVNALVVVAFVLGGLFLIF